MSLAVAVAWALVVAAAALVLMLATLAARRVLRDRSRQARDRTLPP